VFVYRSLFFTIIVLYVLFLRVVLKNPGSVEALGTTRSRGVWTGILVQSLSYPPAWISRRLSVNPFGGGELWLDILIAIFSLAMAGGAIVLAAASKKRLGKHWALAARVVDGHQLVTNGPFGRVRHPIYLSMGLLLLSPLTGFGSWLAAAVALPLFALGTFLRAQAEETILHEAFGAQFEDYRKRVPAYFPRLFRRPTAMDRDQSGDGPGLLL
jgi:protein-S-isoprenylcysteine O-methyltransferase Ste14